MVEIRKWNDSINYDGWCIEEFAKEWQLTYATFSFNFSNFHFCKETRAKKFPTQIFFRNIFPDTKHCFLLNL